MYNYLIRTEEELSKSRGKKSKGLYQRDDKGDFWWELRSCNYMDDFNKQKIIYPCIMSKGPSFALDSDAKFYTIAPGNIISGNNLKYLLAFLNSKTYYFALRKFYMGGGIDGELKTNRLLLLPIPMPEEKIRLLIESKVDLLLNKYAESNILDQNTLNEIEKIIQKYLYLSEEEINIINNSKY